MYFKLLTVFLLFLRLSIAFASEKQCKGFHHIFLVHGIGSKSERTFGHLKATFLAQFKREEIKCHKIHLFNYDTGNDEKSAIHFSIDFQKKVNSLVNKSTDKLSIVAHSQGGIVSLLWMIKSYQREKLYSPSFVDNVVSFTTLSTPFWGAGVASIGNFLRAPYYLPFGKTELREMSYGSDTISKLFNFFTEAQTSYYEDKLRNNIRVLNIGGILQSLSPLQKLGLRTRGLENDLVVSAPSSRLGFLVAKDKRTQYSENDIWGNNEFLKKDFGEFHIVKAGHFRAPYFNLKGTAKIPKKCIKDFNCNHPTLKAIYNNVMEYPLELNRKLALKMTSFRININVNLPNEWLDTHTQDEIKVKFIRNKNDVAKTSKRSGRLSHVSEDMIQARFHYFGSLKEKPEMKLAKGIWYPSQKYLKIKLEAPGLKPRILKVLVKQTYTTFITVNMIK